MHERDPAMQDAHSNMPRPTEVITRAELTLIHKLVDTFIETRGVSGNAFTRFCALEHGHPDRREYARLAAKAGLIVTRAAAVLETLSEDAMRRAVAAGLVDTTMACEWNRAYSQFFVSTEPTECAYFHLASAAMGVLCPERAIWYRNFRDILAEGRPNENEFFEQHRV